MPKIQRHPSAQKLYASIGALIIAFGALMFWAVAMRPASQTQGATLGLPFLNGGGERLPEVPQVYSKNTIFEKIQLLQFTSFVNLPVEAGMMGKKNPFEPFEGFAEEGSAGTGGADQSGTGGIDSDSGSISQGSK